MSSFATVMTSDARSVLVLGSSAVVALTAAVSWWIVWRRPTTNTTPHKDGIPIVRGLPFLGSVQDVFKAPTSFVLKHQQKYGDKFYCQVVGSTWLFLLNEKDVHYVMGLSNKTADSIAAYFELFGFLFPQTKPSPDLPEDFQTYLTAVQSPSVKHIAHALRPPVMNAWIPPVRQVLQQCFDQLPCGKDCRVDLFAFCRDTISKVTTLLMIGEAAVAQPGFLQQWTDLFQQADMEASMGDPYSCLSTMMEVAILGERRIYQRVRELLYPLVDAEIEACIAGEPLTQANPSALQSMIRYRFDRDTFRNNPQRLRQMRTRIANDLFDFSTAAFSNSFAGAGWVMYHVLNNTSGIAGKVKDDLRQWKENPELQSKVPESLQQCLLEITRLYSPGHSLRKLQHAITLPSSGHVIEAGTTVAINFFYSSRQGYSNPLTFDPWRFERGEHKENLFLGFGMGTHPCVGKHLAMLEVVMFCQECLDRGFRLVPTSSTENRDAEFMDTVIDLKEHPNLNKNQSAFLWRPSRPIYMEYDKESQAL